MDKSTNRVLRNRIGTDAPNDLEAFWMPFTDNRGSSAHRALLARAKDMHYYTATDGRARRQRRAVVRRCRA